jgi:hypothetical protein
MSLIKRDSNYDAARGIDTVGAIARQSAANTKQKEEKEKYMMPKIGQPPAASVVSPELLSRIPGTSAYRAAHAKQGGMPKINVYDDGGEVSMGSKLGNYAQGTLSKLGAMNKPDEKKPAAAPVDDSTDPLATWSQVSRTT